MRANQIVSRSNPTTLAKPVGDYSHVTVVSGQADIYTFSGQIGTDLNRDIPKGFNEQVTNTFANITRLLESQELTSEHIIKVNIWSVKQIDWDYFYKVWDPFFKGSYPSMTVAYISGLGLPEIDIEIEIWAAK
ncbi:RidA family protein [Myroides pelagicus]|uniref:RidA family protein n=1 Tax=Myroides pelagicus TaxID=270914 RepID=UPI002DBA1149|nr:RidA family protein [Myroides pelagicus]MEC4114798.1 RidA family protein [Myroides pelagicus]